MIFQDVVPFAASPRPRSRSGGAKVEIGCNDFQGADLSRRLLHGGPRNGHQITRFSAVQRLEHLQLAHPQNIGNVPSVPEFPSLMEHLNCGYRSVRCRYAVTTNPQIHIDRVQLIDDAIRNPRNNGNGSGTEVTRAG